MNDSCECGTGAVSTKEGLVLYLKSQKLVTAVNVFIAMKLKEDCGFVVGFIGFQCAVLGLEFHGKIAGSEKKMKVITGSEKTRL